MQLLILEILFLGTIINLSNGQTGQEAFVITYQNQNYQKASDILSFKASSYSGSPWNLPMASVTSSSFQKSFALWIRHNFTTVLPNDLTISKAASVASANPSTPLSAHYVLYYSSSGSNYVLRLRYYAQATPIQTYTLTSGINLKPYTWYGVFISRYSAGLEAAYLYVYDPSNNYVADAQTNSQNPSGLSPTIATTNFFIDIGGDSNAARACNCEVSNFVFFYNSFYSTTPAVIKELLKMPPKYRERDSTLEMITDYSGVGQSIFRGSSAFDTSKNTPLYWDSTPNGDWGHIYALNSFDTISPAIDLGSEFTVGFWIQMSSRPSSVTNDTYQYVFFKQHSFFQNMQIVIGFQATATTVSTLMIRAGNAFTNIVIPSITRGSGSWQYYVVSFSNLLKNETYSGTFAPTTLYNIYHIDATGSTQSYSGTMAGKFMDGGPTDVMRIGMGEDGQAYNLYAIIKKFQIFTGAWMFRAGSGLCDIYVGVPNLIHMKLGNLLSSIDCLSCQSPNYLYQETCHTTCPSSSYLVSDTRFSHCEDCYYNCLSCNGRKGTQCQTCVIGNWDPFGVLNCPGANPCTSHQYWDGVACQECPNECITCISATACSGCQGGFSFNQNTRVCEIAVCGDGKISAGEQCDDGNQFSGDGCSVSCIVEQGYYCPSTGGSCASICGDNIQASNEECDDGNNANNDGCSFECTIEAGYFCQPPSIVGPFTGVTYEQSCALCTNNLCKTCSSASTCGSCLTGNFLSNGICYSSCASVLSTYQDSTAGVCQACPEFCSACSSATNCSTCTAGNSLNNNTCVTTCPDGMYSAVDPSTSKLTCFSCPASCLTCANSTYCYQCPSSSYLNVISNSQTACVSCDSSCKTCFGSTSNECVLCPDGKILDTINHACVVLNCATNQYADLNIGQCVNCDSTCQTCSNSSSYGCLSCGNGSALTTQGRCYNYSSTIGLIDNSNGTYTEVCGDGLKILKSTECDDGNNIDNDGCSSTCKIESGWACSGGSEFSTDVCTSITGPTPIIKIDPKNPTTVVVSFSKKITNSIQDKEVYQQILVSLEGISSKDASYTITYDSSAQEYYINFKFSKSVVGAYINIKFADSSRISDGYSNLLKGGSISMPYPSYYYVDDQTKDDSKSLTYFSYACQGFNVFLTLSLLLQGKQIYFWIFLEFFQKVQYLTFINLKIPYLAEQFMISFEYLQLKWLPNFPKYSDISYNTQSQISSGGFYEQNKDTFYFINVGTQLSTWAIAIGLWVLAKIIECFLNTFESYLTKKLVKYFVILTEWSLLLRLIIAMFFDFSVMTFLQLSNYSAETETMTASSAMAIVGAGFMAFLPIFIYIKVGLIAKDGRLGTDNKFDLFHSDFKRGSKFSTRFLSLIIIQKIAFAAILVWLQVNTETQLGLLAAQQVIMIFFYLIWRPFADSSLNIRVLWQEFSLFGVISLLYGVLDVNADDSIRNDAAKVIVALLMLTLIYHTLAIFIEALKGFKLGDKEEDKILSKNKLIKKKRVQAKHAKYQDLSRLHGVSQDIPKLDQTERLNLLDRHHSNVSKDNLGTKHNDLSFV